MDKLLHILSELQINVDYISREINEVELLSHQVSESIEAYQENCDEFEQKTNQIEILKEEEQSLYTKIRDREKEFALEMEKLEDLQIEYQNLTRFDENKFVWSENEISKNLEYKTRLFGIDVQAQFIDPTVYQAKITFAENKFVIFNCDIKGNTYDLQFMEPKHGHYEEMRSYLLQTGDISGFLFHVRKFFFQRT